MAAGATFEPIATATPSGPTTYTFSSIPNTYTDLVVVGSVVMDRGTTIRLRFNGSSSGYFNKFYYSDGGVSQNNTNMMEVVDNNGAVFSNFYIDVQNYTGTTLPNKTALARSGDQTYSWLVGSAWQNSAVISSIELFTTNGGQFNSPSRLTLYGIARA